MAEYHSTTTLEDARAKLVAADGEPIADPMSCKRTYLTVASQDLAYVV
jgi:hypothetical protein